MSRNNVNYKGIKQAAHLTRNTVYELLDGQATKSEIDGWSRSETSDKYRVMSEKNFDLLCKNLKRLYEE